MIKGDNAFVPTVPLRIAVRGGVDVAALPLTETGRVRGDADIVFHGAPVHPSGGVRLLGEEHGTVWLEAGLTAIEADIARVLVVGSTESGAMRDVRGLSAQAFALDGTSVARYDAMAGPESEDHAPTTVEVSQWSDWLQRRVSEVSTSSGVLDQLSRSGRTKRVRNLSAERLRALRRGGPPR